MSDNLHAEVVVIGAGPGGYATAFRAADLGKQVILIDKDEALGGVCLNRGCIPSKALLHLAKVIGDAKALEHSGVTFGDPELDLDKIRNWKESVVTKLSNGITQLAKARNVQVIQGLATFDSPTQLSITSKNNQQTLTFDNCIIATGSRAAGIPGTPADHPRIINSTGALKLENIPKRLLIIGGGYIGLEMGSVYNALGSQVTVV
ncbi:MAG: FAD-dependent oxidoreductase, partial [Dehalococcoidia bacterium]|nr:FAD-dependent oxidoreductase [Dehalococcoidia bacterium]